VWEIFIRYEVGLNHFDALAVSPKIEWELCCCPQGGLRRKYWKFPAQMYLMMPGKGTGSSCFLEQRYEVGLRCHKNDYGKLRLRDI
jgi:hypothetical protein